MSLFPPVPYISLINMFYQLQLCYELVKYDHLLLQHKYGFQSPIIGV